jgi:hypothetical protein
MVDDGDAVGATDGAGGGGVGGETEAFIQRRSVDEGVGDRRRKRHVVFV